MAPKRSNRKVAAEAEVAEGSAVEIAAKEIPPNQGLVKPSLTPWSKARCSLTTTSVDGGRRLVPKRRRSCSSSPLGSTVDSGYQHAPSSGGCSSTIRQAKIKTNLDHGAKKVAECLVSRDENATTEQNAKMTKAQIGDVMIDGANLFLDCCS